MPPGTLGANPQGLYIQSYRAGAFWPPVLVLIAVVLNALSHPGLLFMQGNWAFAYVALLPLFLLWRVVTGKSLFILGILWGALSCSSTLYWLGAYHGIALLVALIANALLYAVFFRFFSVISRADKWYTPLFIAAAWIALEYFKSLGFLGNPYGAIGYTQWTMPTMRSIASIGGVWLSGFACILPSAYAARAFNFSNCKILVNSKRLIFAGLLLLGVVSLSAVWLNIDTYDYSKDESLSIRVIQHNMDPWQGGDATYRKNLTTLLTLTKTSLDEILEPADLIVWSETAFAPSIEYHARYRENQLRSEMVSDLLTFAESLPAPLLTGQNHAIRKGFLKDGSHKRIDYNAAYLINGSSRVWYGKQKLVPFTEYFPFGDFFPTLFETIVQKDSSFWEPGPEAILFSVNNVRFATPICFEDSFGYISRRFVNSGAELLINLSNDSWSNSQVAMEQHLAMAVFRSVETKRSTVRSTNGGISTIIYPDGSVGDRLPTFTTGFLNVHAPIVRNAKTLYMLWGDWFGILCVVLLAIAFICGIMSVKIHRTGILQVDSTKKKAQNDNQRKR